MPINVDLSETQRPESAGEYVRVAPGPMHLLVIDAKENGGKKGEHVIVCEVLMHSDQTQIGLQHTEQFPAEANMAWKLLKFAYAVKIADREAMAKAKQSGNNYAPIELKDAIGRQFFATITVTSKTDKTTGKESRFHNLDEILSFDDPRAEKFPRNPGMLSQAVKTMPKGGGSVSASGVATGGATAAGAGAAAGAASAQSAQRQTQPAAAPAAAPADPFAAVT